MKAKTVAILVALAALLGTFVATVARPRPQENSDQPSEWEVLGLLRTLNTVQSVFKGTTGEYVSKCEMLGSKGLLMHKRQHAERNASGTQWMKKLNLESDEILPGWILDFAATTQGYILIISKKVDPENPGAHRDAYITDQEVVIYHAVIPGDKQSKAHDLTSAAAFPGAGSI
jgi:hypothetical protein